VVIKRLFDAAAKDYQMPDFTIFSLLFPWAGLSFNRDPAMISLKFRVAWCYPCTFSEDPKGPSAARAGLR